MIPRFISILLAWIPLGLAAAEHPVLTHDQLLELRAVIDQVIGADGVADNAFVTAAPLPTGETLRGAWMLVAA